MDISKITLSCIFAVLYFIFSAAHGTSVDRGDDVVQVYRNLLENYIPNIRPCHNCSETVNVDIKCHILALNKVDEILGEFVLVAALTLEWSDKRVVWDPKLTGTNSLMFSSKEVWVPPLLLSNPFKEFSSVNKEEMPIRAFYNGTLIWQPFGVFNTKCKYNIYNYPLDVQTCYVMFHPSAYLAKEVNMTAVDRHAKLVPEFEENGEWKLLDAFISTDNLLNLSVTTITINIERRPTFFIVNIICPLILISILNCFGFVIPAANGERISYSVSILMSLTVFMSVVNISIPQTSAPMPIICYYLICVFVGSFLVTLSVLFNTRLYYTDSSNRVPPALKYIFRLIRCGKVNICTESSEQSCDIPRVSQTDSNNASESVGNGIEPHADAFKSHADIDWRDVALLLDNTGLIISCVYFLVINIVFVFV
ncbi:acetylcholine receptor subunit beta-like [Mercenaria mercenaria]|uniref:acetylcholine receptor subunit beta-like n=1 Tax=Mercenaria mercenaria TaxID=6596 RepID=UPI00234E7F4F|nr:acetylcholine receptor subunit beta-like [Mercenaria mercenaria]